VVQRLAETEVPLTRFFQGVREAAGPGLGHRHLHDGPAGRRVVAKFGFMDAPDAPAALERARGQGLNWKSEDTTYYLAHLTLFVHQVGRLGMMTWRDKLFVFLSRNARRATNFFQIPPDRVVEIGIQLEI
jgi:KUP system potassium uptake protein